MSRSTGEKFEGVGQKRQESDERGPSSGGAAGEIENEGFAYGAADGAAEGGEGGVEEAFGAHAFGEAVDDAVADLAGGFGSDVAGGEAGSAGRHNEVGGDGLGAEGVGDLVEFVGQDVGLDAGDTCGLKEVYDGGAGEVGLEPGGAAVADGEDDGAGICAEWRCHLTSLRELQGWGRKAVSVGVN